MPDFICTKCKKPLLNQLYAPKKCNKCGSNVMLMPAVAPAIAIAGIWSSHKNKHMQLMSAFNSVKANKKSALMKETRASTETGAAQYIIPVNAIKVLETSAYAALGNQGGFHNASEVIGFCNGEECTQIQLYVGGDGTFHGQPITDSLVEHRQ